MANTLLHSAKKNKADEFYTRLEDIELELKWYKPFFKGKVVLCNCDDPYESNFFKYFASNFISLEIKKLICTCYDKSPVANTELNLFNAGTVGTQKSKAFSLEINETPDLNSDGAVDLTDIKLLLKSGKNVFKTLKENGDFRSKECIEFLKQADVVVTNPPFSLFRQYVAQLYEYNKKFLIIGNQNAITYKEIFPLIRDNKLWLGYTSGDMAFKVPNYYPPRSTRYWEDKSGQKWRSFGNICWFTNIDIKKRHEVLPLYKKYTPSEYPKYDNYDAINVNKVNDIPCDYKGVMGVPITFLDKYNPDQFDIVAFRKGKDGKDLVFTRERESSTVLSYPCATSIPGMIKNAEGKIKREITYARITIKAKENLSM